MMQIGNVNGNGNAAQAVKDTAKTLNTNTDSVSKEIQGRIASARNKRQEIASNQRMSEEEKSSERQKIQQEISDLKRQLRKQQLEEQKEQKEADKAARKQEEQEKQARAEIIKEQQGSAERSSGRERSETASETERGRSQKKAEDSRGARAEDLKADRASDEEIRKTRQEDMRKSVSKGAAVEQFRVVRKTRQQTDARASVQEAEIKQDEVRGADVEKKMKAQQAETGRKTRQVEMVEEFMFDGKAKESGGTNNQAAVGLKGRGLYTDRGTMFGNLFPADKMDVQQ